MERLRQINNKNRTYYFYGDMINVKDFDSNLLKIDQIWYLLHWIHHKKR